MSDRYFAPPIHVNKPTIRRNIQLTVNVGSLVLTHYEYISLSKKE